MNRREFLETIKKWRIDLDELKRNSYDNYKFVKQMALEEYAETGDNILGDFLIKESNYNELSVKELIKFFEYDDYIDFDEHEYRVLMIYLKIKNALFGELPQGIKLWKRYIKEYEYINSRNVNDVLPLLLDKGCVEIFLDKDFDSFSSSLSTNSVDVEKVVNGIRNGSRLVKEHGIVPNELLYNDEVLFALVDTGQIDAIVENNKIDDYDSYSVKKKKIDKTLKLHKFVPEIIKNLEEVNYNYKDFDVSRMKNFVLDDDYELINNAYVKYKEDIKNVRFIPQEDKKKEIDGKDIIVNMLDEGIVTRDELLEIIVDYGNKEKGLKKIK